MKSLTESELVGVNDMIPIMLWICNFLLEQGERIMEDLLLDNKSPILLEQNGKTSSKVRMKGINIERCHTQDMVPDFTTKPLQGIHFKRLRDITMGKKQSVKPNGVQVVTGKGNV